MVKQIVRALSIALALVGVALIGLVITLRGPRARSVDGAPERRPVSPARLEHDVRHLVGELTPRWYQPPENLDRAADWVRERMEEAGFDVREVVSKLPEGSYRNLVAQRTGTDPGAGAIVIGAASGVICYLASTKLKNALGYDDSLDVVGIHGVGGAWGALATGIFAAAAIGGTSGMLEGNPGLVWAQFVGIIATIAYSLIVSLMLFKVIDLVMGLRVSEEDEMSGLDLSQHGEEGYSL